MMSQTDENTHMGVYVWIFKFFISFLTSAKNTVSSSGDHPNILVNTAKLIDSKPPP